jgi:hypothetical protein
MHMIKNNAQNTCTQTLRIEEANNLFTFIVKSFSHLLFPSTALSLIRL